MNLTDEGIDLSQERQAQPDVNGIAHQKDK